MAHLAFGAETRMRSNARGLSMMARNTNVPFKGRIQKRKTNHLQIITFGLQRAAEQVQHPPRNRLTRGYIAYSRSAPISGDLTR